jgi:UDP-N-acetylglucosamine 2-epimerase (non-hydrolysing)
MRKKISVVFGTRPEAIKLAAVILELKRNENFEVNVCITAQHREMLDQVLKVFEINPDVDLGLMKDNQTLSDLSARILPAMDSYYKNYKPDLVLVQGDTTTTFIASLAAYYNRIKIAHVEAGLRTWNKYSPFPEEINRVLTSKLADLHFAPTKISKGNLITEGVQQEKIFITGNTVIDALLLASEKIKNNTIKIPGLRNDIHSGNGNIILITGHRRESFGEGFKNICQAISFLAEEFADYNFIYPVHLNPNVRKPVFEILSSKKNIFLIEPLDYLPFVSLMNESKLILTDSGGIQEEAPSLGKPVLVMRDTSERPEGISAGTAKLVGVKREEIIKEVKKLLLSKHEYSKMANVVNPYGDGKASARIAGIIFSELIKNTD